MKARISPASRPPVRLCMHTRASIIIKTRKPRRHAPRMKQGLVFAAFFREERDRL